MDHLSVVTTQWGFIFVKIADIIAQKYVIGWEKCLLFLHRGLADTKQTGKLNEEQFALAMHLIQQKVNKGIDPPSALTPDMIPPSERSASSAMGFVSSAYTIFQPLLHLSVCQFITISFFFFSFSFFLTKCLLKIAFCETRTWFLFLRCTLWVVGPLPQGGALVLLYSLSLFQREGEQ